MAEVGAPTQKAAPEGLSERPPFQPFCMAWKPKCEDTYCAGMPSSVTENCALAATEPIDLFTANLGDKRMCLLVMGAEGDTLYGASEASPECTMDLMQQLRDNMTACSTALYGDEAVAPIAARECPFPPTILKPCGPNEVMKLEEDGSLRCFEPMMESINIILKDPNSP